MRETIEKLWDTVTDPYWRLDHPEFTALTLAVITGVIGLFFAWVQQRILRGGGE